ncbi:MAG TPA: hypothetical protein VM912_13505 [Terriglobales bacterium]|nr:hypothetical protein [Terriglobales bacterium]
MKHFTTEEWIDFVNEVTPQRKQEAMRKHLASGCRACEQKFSLWQKVRCTAASEAKYQPPADAVRIVKAAYAGARTGSQREEGESLVEVLFDSFLQPATAGARSRATGARQMLYRADSFQLDLQIEPKPGTNHVLVTGQMMDVSTPEIVSSGVQIKLSNFRENVIYTVTNEFGEFHCEIDNSGDLELSVPGRTGKPISISLRNALGDWPRGRA